MVKIDLTKEEIEKVVQMMSSSSVPMKYAEEALELFKKFKNAKV